ncbi:non-histone protein [Polyrhizophydium stewartii]|uniref:Non-histone protein n=1 Tax=Polyrhizophydium stewartii TaxID=2732419 RepID=A0ABR4N9P3_9FUNG
MLLRSLPPPARSDGVPVLLPATHFREADANTLVSLLVQLTPQVSQCAGGDGVHIAHTATLAGLPHGYRLYLSTTSHGVVLITGHPSGRYFESPAEFVQHLLWLFDAQVQARACDCRLCQQQAQQQQAQQQQQQQQAQQQPHPGQMAAVHTAKPAQMTLAQSAHSPFAPSPFQPQWFREDPMASMNVAAAHMNMMSMALQMGSAHSPGGQVAHLGFTQQSPAVSAPGQPFAQSVAPSPVAAAGFSSLPHAPVASPSISQHLPQGTAPHPQQHQAQHSQQYAPQLSPAPAAVPQMHNRPMSHASAHMMAQTSMAPSHPQTPMQAPPAAPAPTQTPAAKQSQPKQAQSSTKRQRESQKQQQQQQQQQQDSAAAFLAPAVTPAPPTRTPRASKAAAQRQQQRLLEQQEQELQLHSDDAGSQHAGGAADKEGPMDPVTEERFKRRYAMLRQEFEKVEKQIGKFDRAIATARKKMDRLKFERQVLLQMFVAHDAQQRGSDQGSSVCYAFSGPVTCVHMLTHGLAWIWMQDDDSSVEENPSKKAAHSRTVSGQDSEANHANDSGDGEEDDEGGDDGRDGEEDGADVGGGGYDDEDEGEDDDTGTASTTPKRKRNPRKRPKVVDPNAPKRPANAFMLFCDMQRENLKEERKELQKSQTSGEQEASTSNLTKMLGHRWRSLSEAERQHYHDLFREQVKQYDRDLSEYFRSNPNAVYADMVESTSLLPDMSDDPNAPKKPANVFFVFCEMEREQLKEQRRKLKEALPGSEEEAGLSNITKALGQKWRSLSDAERQVYQDRFRQQLETYTQYVEQKLLSMPLEAVAKVAAKRAGGAGIGLANHGGAAALRAADDGLPASELHSEAAISLEEFGVDLDDEPAAPVAAVAVAAAAAVRHGSNGAAAPAPAVGVAGAGAVSVVDTDAMEEDPDDVDLGDLDVDDLDEDDEDDEGGDGESSEE